MPAEWTGKLIGDIHNAGLSIGEVTKRSGLSRTYVSTVLNQNKEKPKTQAKLREALEALKKEREDAENKA